MNRQQALQILHLSGSESEDEYNKAKRQALRHAHPDMPTGSEEAFIEVQEAISLLDRVGRSQRVFKFSNSPLSPVLS